MLSSILCVEANGHSRISRVIVDVFVHYRSIQLDGYKPLKKAMQGLSTSSKATPSALRPMQSSELRLAKL